MHIVMFSINPLFAHRVMGGAPKHLQNIAVHMGKLGHEVSVLCTRTDETHTQFLWHPNVTVYPILRFKQPFPQPYAIPAYDLASALQDVGDYLARADRFYLHDGEFLFPYAYQHIPTVVSLRDNVYPETLIGGFLFQGATLVLISEYSRQYFQHTVGRFFPQLSERIQVIHNGLDWYVFKPTKPDEILEIIPIDPQSKQIVLHPHRPEESKGIMLMIDVVDRLVNQYGMRNVVGLAPKWLDAQLTPDLRQFYDDVLDQIAVRGLTDNFIFHDWIPQNLMPQYYSMACVTLSMGNFVESFGNAVYESMGCGTKSIAARVSTHRELMPDYLLDKVDYGDVERTAELASRIIVNDEKPSPEAIAYLHQTYGIDRQLNAYADAILNADTAEPLQYRHPSLDDYTRYCLAPWCYHSEKGIYHDFLADHHTLPELEALIQAYPDSFGLDEAEKMTLSSKQIESLYRDGFIVPLITYQDNS